MYIYKLDFVNPLKECYERRILCDSTIFFPNTSLTRICNVIAQARPFNPHKISPFRPQPEHKSGVCATYIYKRSKFIYLISQDPSSGYE